jgi:hypothetical protein
MFKTIIATSLMSAVPRRKVSIQQQIASRSFETK